MITTDIHLGTRWVVKSSLLFCWNVKVFLPSRSTMTRGVPPTANEALPALSGWDHISSTTV